MSDQPAEVPATQPFEDLPSLYLPVESPPSDNPHRLPLQILGLCVASVVAFLFGVLPIVVFGLRIMAIMVRSTGRA
jgi:hypothetical protein